MGLTKGSTKQRQARSNPVLAPPPLSLPAQTASPEDDEQSEGDDLIIDPSTVTDPERLIRAASAALTSSEYARAAACADRLLQLDPTHVKAAEYAALARLEMGEAEQAIEIFQRIVQQHQTQAQSAPPNQPTSAYNEMSWLDALLYLAQLQPKASLALSHYKEALGKLESMDGLEDAQVERMYDLTKADLRRKSSSTLCAIIDLYHTDLSSVLSSPLTVDECTESSSAEENFRRRPKLAIGIPNRHRRSILVIPRSG